MQQGMIKRRETKRINLGEVAIGGGAPIAVQTMTSTDTRAIEATVEQIQSAVALGCDIIRIAVPNRVAAEALCGIRTRVEDIPLVADIHFDYQLALMALEAGIDGLRINPGNIGGRDRIRAVVKAASKRAIPIRIGVNAGSLEEDIMQSHGGANAEALCASALRHVGLLEEAGHTAIKISVKSSDIITTIAAYRLLAERTAYPLHLGLTEAGTGWAGTIRSCAALGALLAEGIGDTLRISLSDAPEEEVRVGLELLRSMGLREGGVHVTACPTCGRTRVDVSAAARALEKALEEHYRVKPRKDRLRVAVMGCVVNGPGEARDADVALVGVAQDRFRLYVAGSPEKLYDTQEGIKAVIRTVERL